MYSTETKFDIYVGNKPVREYFHEGRYYIEGRKDHEYTIRVQNLSAKRKKIVVSVDGLNIMTGDSTWERGYCLNPWQQLDIPGWRKDSNDTAAFTFGSVGESYNEHNRSGDVNNVGVIGCKVFDEVPKPVQIVKEYIPVYHYYNPRPVQYKSPDWNYWGGQYTFHNTAGGWGGSLGALGGGISGASGGPIQFQSTAGGTPESYQMAFGAAQAKSAMDISNQTVNFADCAPLCAPDREVKTSGFVQQELGTKWGRNKEFKTQTVYYDFLDIPIDVFTLYYDTKRGLTRRGINLYDYTYSPKTPNPFPSDGCPSPVRK